MGFKISAYNICSRLLQAFYLLAVVILLNGCMLSKMEDITQATRDEVHATNEAIHSTEHAQILGYEHKKLLDTTLAPSIRVNAAKSVLAKYPEENLATDLGLPLPSFHIPGFKKPMGGAEIDFPNVTFIGDKISRHLGVAPVDRQLYDIVKFAAVDMTFKLIAKTSQAGADLAAYRPVVGRLVFIVPALLAAIQIEDLEEPLKNLTLLQASGQIDPAAFSTRLNFAIQNSKRAVPDAETRVVLGALEKLAKNVSLDEPTIQEMRSLISARIRLN